VAVRGEGGRFGAALALRLLASHSGTEVGVAGGRGCRFGAALALPLLASRSGTEVGVAGDVGAALGWQSDFRVGTGSV
jgi:hypothetical protein